MRILLAAWVGAAALSVIVGIREVRWPEFDSAVKNQLVALRFPAYYAFGFSCVTISLVAGLLARRQTELSIRSLWIVNLLVAVALVAMLIDYQFIYRPLYEMITQEDVLSGHFHRFHEASKYINLFDVVLCFIACLVLHRSSPKKP
jgi:hypothetical protein